MEQFEYNQQYYEHGISGFHKSSFAKIAAAFEAGVRSIPTKAKILDFGCGNGFYGPFLSTKSTELDGVDASSGLLGHTRRNCYKSFELVDLGRPWNPIGKYDVVFSIEVIEHVQDYHQFLKNAFLALKPGGRLFLTSTTYFWSLFVLLIIFRRKTSVETLSEFMRGFLGDEYARTKFVVRFWDYFGGHYHGFSKRQLRRALEEAGFIVERVDFLHVQKVFPVHYLAQPYRHKHKWVVNSILPWLKFAGSAINWVCERFDLSAPNVVVIAKKPIEAK